MRFLLGMVAGAVLIVGAAWYVDAKRVGDLGGPLVNWERLDKGWGDMRDALRAQLRRLAG